MGRVSQETIDKLNAFIDSLPVYSAEQRSENSVKGCWGQRYFGSGGEAYLYVASCPAFPRLLKIGITSCSPQSRCSSLHGSGPHRFSLVAAWQFPDNAPMRQIEKIVFSHISHHHHSGEFFRGTCFSELVQLLNNTKTNKIARCM